MYIAYILNDISFLWACMGSRTEIARPELVKLFGRSSNLYGKNGNAANTYETGMHITLRLACMAGRMALTPPCQVVLTAQSTK